MGYYLVILGPLVLVQGVCSSISDGLSFAFTSGLTVDDVVANCFGHSGVINEFGLVSDWLLGNWLQ